MNFYHKSVSLYADSVNALRRSRRVDFKALQSTAGGDRLAAESARIKFEKHCREHGCS